MKRFLCLFSVLLCLLGLSVNTFAAGGNNFSYGSNDNHLISDYIVDMGDYYTFKNPFPISKQSQEIQAFWSEFTDSLEGKTKTIPLIIYGSGGSFYLLALDSDYTFSLNQSGVAVLNYVSPQRVLCFTIGSTGFFSNFRIEGARTASGIGPTASSAVVSGYLIVAGHSSLVNLPAQAAYLDKAFLVEDDLGKDEPEPDVSSSDISIPPYVPPDPVIPSGNEWVPYDTGVWKKFLDHIRKNVGAIANIGFLILAAITGVILIKKVANAFTKLF